MLTSAESTSTATGVLDRVANGLAAHSRKAEYPISMPMGDWGRAFFPEYFTEPDGSHHVEIDQILQSIAHERDARLVLIAPRGFAKSTRTTFLYPLWLVCHKLERYIILMADTYSQAVKYLKAIKHELEHNEALAEVYPEACGKGPEWNNEGLLTRNGIQIEPLGTGQKIRGRRDKDKRPTLIVLDDPEGDSAAHSARERETVRDWATKGVFKAGAPGSNIVLAGTLIHRDCLLGHCNRLPAWKTRSWQAIVSWPHRMDLWERWELLLRERDNPQSEQLANQFLKKNRAAMKKGATTLWPARFPLQDLMLTRASEGHASFLSEMQNKPVDPSMCEWEPKLFEGPSIWFDKWPEDPLTVVMALDPSKGKNDRAGDYQAVVTLSVSQEGDLYLDADLARRSIDQMLANFVLMSKEVGPDVCVCEADQFQELLIPMIEELATKEELLCPVEGISTHNKPKPIRIRRMGPYICRQRIRFKRNSPGALLLMQQYQDFPNADYDDGPDAAEMALRRATRLLAQQRAGKGRTSENPY